MRGPRRAVNWYIPAYIDIDMAGSPLEIGPFDAQVWGPVGSSLVITVPQWIAEKLKLEKGSMISVKVGLPEFTIGPISERQGLWDYIQLRREHFKFFPKEGWIGIRFRGTSHRHRVPGASTAISGFGYLTREFPHPRAFTLRVLEPNRLYEVVSVVSREGQVIDFDTPSEGTPGVP